MTGMNCLEAEKYWKDKGGAVGYLIACGVVAIETDEESKKKYISISGDEEGNFDAIKLNKKAALWLADMLKTLARGVE